MSFYRRFHLSGLDAAFGYLDMRAIDGSSCGITISMLRTVR